MFSQKVIIVTGASSGLGAGIAIRFAKEQAKVCIAGRNAKNLEDTAKKCVEDGGEKPLMVVGDVTSEDHLKEIVNKTVETYGRIDILVNNAGTVNVKCLEDGSVEDYDTVFDTNLKSVYILSKSVLPYLIKTKGNIINVSSLAGMKSYPGSLTYNMSKAALDQFTKCTALELAPKGIRVNSVNPGYIPTNFTRFLHLTNEELEMFKAQYKDLVPLGRNGVVEDLVEAVMFLASDRASFITGHLLPVDGGRGLATPRPIFNKVD